MIYKKQSSVSGKWAKASELANIKRAKIVSETSSQPSTFLNPDGSAKTQEVCKVQFEGSTETLNLSLNKPTIQGLISAFGEDSINWQNHYLTVETEKLRIGGKAVVALYLIPEGYERIDNESGYTVIVKKMSVDPTKIVTGDTRFKFNVPVNQEVAPDDIIAEDLPF